MTRLAICAALALADAGGGVSAQDAQVPWTVVDGPSIGWSAAGLAEVRAFADSIGTAAMIVVTETSAVIAMGTLDREFRAHSLRKSFLSALLGIAVAQDQVDVDATLEELQVDDRSPLSPSEKSASVLELMQSRSGVYHAAASETRAMRLDRLPRNLHEPGTHWHYNNWDFNTLGSIYSSLTGVQIGDAFAKEVAEPIGLMDFSPDAVRYQLESEVSRHAAYKFRISARDLTRFGLLYLNAGRWAGRQVVPASWITASTQVHSETDERGTKSGYGLMWWVTAPGSHGLPEGSFTASGAGGQRLTVIPSLRTVVVHLMDTDAPDGPRIATSTYNELLRVLLAARTN